MLTYGTQQQAPHDPLRIIRLTKMPINYKSLKKRQIILGCVSKMFYRLLWVESCSHQIHFFFWLCRVACGILVP